LLSRLDRHRCNGAQHLGCDCVVDALAAEAEATLLTQLQIRLVASVDWSGITTGVSNVEPAATACATDEAGEQCASAPSGLRVAHRAVSVAGEQRLIALVLGPTDVAVVMIPDEYLPRAHRLAVAIALARTTIDDRGALLTLPVGIDASIEGVLENRDDIAIPDRPPL